MPHGNGPFVRLNISHPKFESIEDEYSQANERPCAVVNYLNKMSGLKGSKFDRRNLDRPDHLDVLKGGLDEFDRSPTSTLVIAYETKAKNGSYTPVILTSHNGKKETITPGPGPTAFVYTQGSNKLVTHAIGSREGTLRVSAVLKLRGGNGSRFYRDGPLLKHDGVRVHLEPSKAELDDLRQEFNCM